ncbi:TadE family type IV pilus minor pilin [Microlunatus panaciterrae]|uniref:TadE-like protein n=1 Tax=Microlunatus panaciterrae TaxID=400768 RepID=A0ABS2RJP0_9ACTN|nr:TadE family type IV pilus minor pilin [Microlunatus panaciterrae]MBM7799228.1 hypothetical protein [Microlunatus panaciterrae]
MVTVELAFGSLALVGLLIMICWAVFLVVMQVRCIDTAAEVARQAARGDAAGVRQSRRDAPADATIAIHEGPDAVRVQVELRARPFRRGLPAVPIRAGAVAIWEPGEHER